jgi:hypothetical protein
VQPREAIEYFVAHRKRAICKSHISAMQGEYANAQVASTHTRNPYNKTFNVLVKDADWKSKASMTASYDFAMYIKKLKSSLTPKSCPSHRRY